MENQKETQVLEINLISAQGLKEPSGNLRRLQTYAVAWVDPSAKLRTRLDSIGCENPTWNDKFFFRVSSDFLSSETSGVCIEIYAVGYIRDQLIGTVRFLVSNFILTSPEKTPSFVALQIRRPSGRFHGILNIGAMVIDESDFAADMSKVRAIGYRDHMEQKSFRRRTSKRNESTVSPASAESFDGSENSKENSVGGSADFSDSQDSVQSSPLSAAPSPLTDWNAIRDAAKRHRPKSASDGGGILACFSMRSPRTCIGVEALQEKN